MLADMPGWARSVSKLLRPGRSPVNREHVRRLHPSSLPCCLENHRILLANSSEQNPCGKICSHHGAKLNKNRTSALTNSTIMQSIVCVCRLVVISPTVSVRFRYTETFGETCLEEVTGRPGAA